MFLQGQSPWPCDLQPLMEMPKGSHSCSAAHPAFWKDNENIPGASGLLNPIPLMAHSIFEEVNIYYCNKYHFHTSWEPKWLREPKKGDSLGWKRLGRPNFTKKTHRLGYEIGVSEKGNCRCLYKVEILKLRFSDFRISNICFPFLIHLSCGKDTKGTDFSRPENRMTCTWGHIHFLSGMMTAFWYRESQDAKRYRQMEH